MRMIRREEGDSLFKVVYICSNAAIADQNLRKLRITSEAQTESASSSRLSMQHLNIFKQENDSELLDRYIQLIPLTPDTSFRMTAGAGTKEERALMFAILKRLPELQEYLCELEVAMMDYATSGWNAWCKNYYEQEATACNEKSGGRYFAYMKEHLAQELATIWHDDLTFMEAIKELCKKIRANNGKRVGENGIIGQLRVIFAKISLSTQGKTPHSTFHAKTFHPKVHYIELLRASLFCSYSSWHVANSIDSDHAASQNRNINSLIICLVDICCAGMCSGNLYSIYLRSWNRNSLHTKFVHYFFW